MEKGHVNFLIIKKSILIYTSLKDAEKPIYFFQLDIGNWRASGVISNT